MSAARAKPKAVRLATLRDVGRAAGGYHHSTVSLALRNSPLIRPSVRTSIRRAARKIGYHRDPLLDAFNQHRLEVAKRRVPRTIAVVGDLPSRRELESSYRHRAIWRGIVETGEPLGYGFEYFPLGRGGLSAARLDAILFARGIAGVVIVGLDPQTAPPVLAWERLSAVRIESGHCESPRCVVAPDLLQGASEAFEQLRWRGCVRVGLVTTVPADPLRAAMVRAGFLLGQWRRSDVERLPPLEIGWEQPTRLVRTWMRRFKPDGIVADPEALAVLTTVGETRTCEWASTDLVDGEREGVGLAIDYAALGATAVSQLIGQMRSGERGDSCGDSITLVATRWRGSRGGDTMAR